MKRILCVFLLFIISNQAFSQKYIFTPYGVQDGLAQSQPLSIIQNRKNELFIGSLGGLSRFDGSHFINYNRRNGLPHNIIYSLAIDSQQNIWSATPNGLSRFDGRRFHTFNSPESNNSIQEVVVDKQNTVWALNSGKLLRLRNNQLEIEPLETESLALTKDNSGLVWVFNYNAGIFVWNGRNWHEEINTQNQKDFLIYKMVFGKFSGTLYAITSKGLKIAEQGKFISPEWLSTFPDASFISSIWEEKNGNIWLATEEGGAWLFNQNKWINFNYDNGFVNESVTTFFEDNEQNIWLATNGAGIFRFAGNSFTFFDRGSGLSSPSIMSITKDKVGQLYFIGNDNSFYKMRKGEINRISLPEGFPKINILFTDSMGTLWLGTDNGGLWTFDKGKFKRFSPKPAQNMFGITNFSESQGNLWISANSGLFHLKDQQISRENISFPVYSSQYISGDSILIGTLNGAFLYHIDQKKLNPVPFLKNITVLTMTSDKKNMYIGTDDRGVIVWNKAQKKSTVLGESQGLSCNYIYSLLIDRLGNLWVGTGCGINKISLDNKGSYQIFQFEQSNGIKGMESNANAALEDNEGFLWFGTNRALFRYNPYVSQLGKKEFPTQVIFQSIKLFSKEIPVQKYSDSTLPFSSLPFNPILPTSQNHLTFTFKGISMSNPDQIKYRYRLEGIDKDFTETNLNTVSYPNLPPGHYIFKVWASNFNDHWDAQPALYPFTINTPFYTTVWFRIGLTLLIISFFLGLVYYRNQNQKAKLLWAQQLKEEEQARVRQKTAEDFHDEIGNKLTRISLLATIAENKMSASPAELKSILSQIKENANLLYKGAKDIIWSLQPESDYLDEVIFKIKQNSSDLLEGTSIRFEYEKIGDWTTQIQLPPDYSRNIILIFKEAVNNMVKHAAASHLKFTVQKQHQLILMSLRDDGKGFIPGSGEGNGLRNMQNRANRIKGELKIQSQPDLGTTIILKFHL